MADSRGHPGRAPLHERRRRPHLLGVDLLDLRSADPPPAFRVVGLVVTWPFGSGEVSRAGGRVSAGAGISALSPVPSSFSVGAGPGAWMGQQAKRLDRVHGGPRLVLFRAHRRPRDSVGPARSESLPGEARAILHAAR